MKILGVLMILTAFTWFGFRISRSYQRRVTFLASLLLFLEKLKGELQYYAIPMDEMLSTFSNEADAPVRAICKETRARLLADETLAFPSAWKAAVRSAMDRGELGDEESRALGGLGDILGQYPVDVQVAAFERCMGELRLIRETAIQEIKQKGNVYRTCSIAAGVMVALVLI